MGSKTPAIRGSLARSEVTSTLIDKVNVELFASCIPAAPVETVPFCSEWPASVSWDSHTLLRVQY